MVSFMRTVAVSAGAATAAVAAASAIPVALASCSSTSFSNPLNSRNPKAQYISFPFLSRSSPRRLGLARNFVNSPMAAVRADAPASDVKVSQDDVAMPELLTEFMVDMKCEGCVTAVKDKLQSVEGIKNVEVDLPNQVVRITGSSSVKTMTEALERTGRKARLIGQGVPEDFLVSAAVAEFKGPNVFGVVRFAQVNMELTKIEANFSGLSSQKHGWSINEYGDLTRGAASTGRIYSPLRDQTGTEPLGDLGTLEVNQNGEAFYSGTKKQMRVVDLVGRAVVVYETEEKSAAGLTAAVIARSAGVGENYKKLCTCDGTTIWEATNNDFVNSKV